jgi:hypothetical protein
MPGLIRAGFAENIRFNSNIVRCFTASSEARTEQTKVTLLPGRYL